MNGLALIAALLALAGLAQAAIGLGLLRRFRAPPPAALLPISVLKPLHGDEPLLETALASFCMQEYPVFQIVFGVQRTDDPALAVVRRLQARFPGCDIAVVVDPSRHGTNGKVSNLINMLPAARHPVLVIADADVHAAPDHLVRVAEALAQPGTGLVTTLYSGLAADAGLAARLGASAITHGFLPGALLGRALGRQDCLGATMALRRETLAAIGGLPALANELADDNVLGERVRALGLAVRLAASIPATTVAETELSALLRHELRWARTIRALVPGAFALSSLQYPLAWAALALVLSNAGGWPVLGFIAVWLARAGLAAGVDRALPALPRATRVPFWLLPMRDLLSIGIILASYAGNTVEWRGQILTAGGTRGRAGGAEGVVPPGSLV